MEKIPSEGALRMQPYVIFTESTGDLTPALIERAGLRVLPMSFNLDGQAYRKLARRAGDQPPRLL